MNQYNSQAFPRIDGIEDNGNGTYSVICTPGMTLRDYFAGQALVGLLAQSNGTATISPHDEGAKYAYEMADAMLEAREQE